MIPFGELVKCLSDRAVCVTESHEARCVELHRKATEVLQQLESQKPSLKSCGVTYRYSRGAKTYEIPDVPNHHVECPVGMEPAGPAIKLAELLIQLVFGCQSWDVAKLISNLDMEEFHKNNYLLVRPSHTPAESLLKVHWYINDVFRCLETHRCANASTNDILVAHAVQVLWTFCFAYAEAYHWDLDRALKIKLIYDQVQKERTPLPVSA